ncbi:hypothetical protein CJ671_05535 [Aliarcobacter cryaerophilus]|uniref:Uncharacterized protein n=1 Tax=Aliarcobacter cryaerophilus TaxID=28198 RepID=A0A2S9STB6_9BACT|nr:hypothetical protein [Aliarcobacter cryaerophilus]PRM89824.1 hypothetical protein CJ671_05535 [Aliarcobacter cryaerophilus]
MTLDLLIPFGILLILVIYLIYTRVKFEKNIVKLYENKLEEWKKHSKNDEKIEHKKDLIALVFKKDYKISIEYFDEKIEDNLKRAKFEIYKYGIKDEEK